MNDSACSVNRRSSKVAGNECSEFSALSVWLSARPVGGLTWNYAPYAASRVLHVALTTRDQVYMGVTNSLSGSVAVVHTDVEAAYRSILFHNLDPKAAQQLIDCTPLRLEQVEESCRVPFGYHERMQVRHRVVVTDRKGEGIRGQGAVRWKLAKDAV